MGSGDAVLVIGATGGCGRHAFKACLEGGYRCRAMIRDKAKAQAVLGPDADVVEGDLMKPETLAAAMANTRYVILAVGPVRSEKGGGAQRTYEGVVNAAAAAKRAGVQKVVHITTNGIDSPKRPFISFLNHMTGLGIGWKLREEQALRDSGVPYVVVRPVGLKDRGGDDVPPVIKQCKPYEWGMCSISRAVVGRICVEALAHSPGSVTLNCREDPDAKGKEGGIKDYDWAGAFASLKRDEPIPCTFEDHAEATRSFVTKLRLTQIGCGTACLLGLASIFV